MSAQHAEQAARPCYPEKTLAGIVAVLADAVVDCDVREEFQAALKKMEAAAKACDCFNPIADLVEAWWPQAMFWTEPDKAREVLARVERYEQEGPPPPEQRHSAAEVKAALEARHGREMGPAWAKLAGLG